MAIRYKYGFRRKFTSKVTGISLFGVSALTAYQLWIRPWQLRWGATDEGIAIFLPGDKIARSLNFNATRAITVNAPPEDI